MIYKFKSKATGDVIMLGPNGDQLLRLIGKAPAAQGILEPAAMPAALAALEQAVAADEAARAQSQEGSPADAGADGDAGAAGARPEVALRQRVWPMVEMIRRALAEREPIVWGA